MVVSQLLVISFCFSITEICMFLSGLGQWVTNPRSKLATRWKTYTPRQCSQDARA